MASDRSLELRQCAMSWEPGARLLGNVQAREIISMVDELQRLRRVLEAARDYKSEQTNPVKDYTMVTRRRDQMFAAIEAAEVDDGNV